MSAPTAPLAAAIWADTEPLWRDDDPDNTAGATLVTAIAAPGETVYAISNKPDSWWDPAEAEDAQIRGMASRAGIPNVRAQSIANLRYRLENPPAFEVGSTEAIREAVRALVGGTAVVTIKSGYQPGAGYVWGHTTVIVSALEAGSTTESQIQTAAEQGAPDWIVIHAHIGTAWSQVAGEHASWTEAATDHATWSDMAGGH